MLLECGHCFRNSLASLRALAQMTKTSSRCFGKNSCSVPRRCILYVPGNDERKILKSLKLDADCAVLDCEDGVALNQKEAARKTIVKMLEDRLFDNVRTEFAVRINSVDSGLAEDDLKTLLQSKVLPTTLLLPKVNSVEHISWFADKLSSNLQGRVVTEQFKLIFYVESAIGLLNLHGICKYASEQSAFDLQGIVFGSDDFCADIGATRSMEAKEIFYARQHIVVVAKAFELQAIDIVFIDYRDLDSLQKQSIEGASMGFTGKQVIHPSQVPVVQKAFSPSKEKIEWATQLIQAFERHQKLGKGAFTFRGQMIDRPLLLQAENIIQLSSLINK